MNEFNINNHNLNDIRSLEFDYCQQQEDDTRVHTAMLLANFIKFFNIQLSKSSTSS